MVVIPKPDPNRPKTGSGSPQRPPRVPRTVFSLSEEETYALGATLGRGLERSVLIVLEGDLGLGKTVLTRGIAEGLGVPPEDVSSPSYTLIQEYSGGRLPMFHVDLYRIESVEEIETLGLDEILSSDGVIVVEWGERLPAAHRQTAITVRFHDVGEDSRRIEILSEPIAASPTHDDA